MACPSRSSGNRNDRANSVCPQIRVREQCSGSAPSRAIVHDLAGPGLLGQTWSRIGPVAGTARRSSLALASLMPALAFRCSMSPSNSATVHWSASQRLACPLNDQVEHRLCIARRGGHHLQHVDGGGLLLDPLAELAVALGAASRQHASASAASRASPASRSRRSSAMVR